MYTCVCVYVYIYIYIYRERERLYTFSQSRSVEQNLLSCGLKANLGRQGRPKPAHRKRGAAHQAVASAGPLGSPQRSSGTLAPDQPTSSKCYSCHTCHKRWSSAASSCGATHAPRWPGEQLHPA